MDCIGLCKESIILTLCRETGGGIFLFVEKMWKAVKCCGIIEMLSNLQQKGGDAMEYIIRFLVSVMASVTGYYIRKWLDRNDKDS